MLSTIILIGCPRWTPGSSNSSSSVPVAIPSASLAKLYKSEVSVLFINQDVIIYVKLLDEGTLVYRPTNGVLLGEDTARLREPEDFDPDEEWEFPIGAIVTISRKQFESGEIWVAVALADSGIR
jgi:hypothetical protein